MAINRSANRRTITGSKRAEVERNILKKSGLLASTSGFSKFTREPFKSVTTEVEVNEPDDNGLIDIAINVGLNGDIQIERGHMKCVDPGDLHGGGVLISAHFSFDPKTGVVEFQDWESAE